MMSNFSVIHEKHRENKKCKQKSKGRATNRSDSQPPTPGGRKKVTDQCVQSQQTNARQAQRPAPSSPSQAIKMPKGQKKQNKVLIQRPGMNV